MCKLFTEIAVKIGFQKASILIYDNHCRALHLKEVNDIYLIKHKKMFTTVNSKSVVERYILMHVIQNKLKSMREILEGVGRSLNSFNTVLNLSTFRSAGIHENHFNISYNCKRYPVDADVTHYSKKKTPSFYQIDENSQRKTLSKLLIRNCTKS